MLKYVPGEQKEGQVVMEAMPKDLEYIPFIITEELNYGEAADTVMDMLLADSNTCVLLQTDGQNVADLLHKCVDYASNSLPLHVCNIDTTQRVEHTWIPVVPNLRPLLVQWEKRGTAVLLSRPPLPSKMSNVQQPLSRGRDADHGSMKKNKRSNRKFSPNSRKSWNYNKSKDTRGYDDRRRRQTAPTAGPSEHDSVGYSDDHQAAIATSAAASPGNLKAEQKGGARSRATNLNGTSGANFKSSGTLQSHGSVHSNESLPLCSRESVPGSQMSVSNDSTRKSDDVRLDNKTAHSVLSSDYRRTAMNRRNDLQPTDAVRQRTPHHPNHYNDHSDSYDDHRNSGGRWDRRRGGGRTDYRNTNTTVGRGRGNKEGGGRGSNQLRNSEFERGMGTSGNKNSYPSSDTRPGYFSGVQSSPSDPSNTEPTNHGEKDISLGSENLCGGGMTDDTNNGSIISGGSGVHVKPAAASTTNLDSYDSVAGLCATVVESSSDVPSVTLSRNAANTLQKLDLEKKFPSLDTTDSAPAAVVAYPGDRGPTDTVVRSDQDSKKEPGSCSADAGKECYSSMDCPTPSHEVFAKSVKHNSGSNSRGRRRKKSSKSEETTFCSTDEISVC